MKIINYQEINKGNLLAKFDVQIEQWSLTIRDCALIQKKDGDGRFIALPGKQYQSKDGQTKNYQLIVFEKSMQLRFQSKCLELIAKGEFEKKVSMTTSTNSNLPF